MSTALVHFKLTNGDHIVTINKVFDAYPKALGQTLVDIISKKELISSIDYNAKKVDLTTLSVGCFDLVAQIIKELKLLYPAGNTFVVPEKYITTADYVYTFTFDSEDLTQLTSISLNRKVFEELPLKSFKTHIRLLGE